MFSDPDIFIKVFTLTWIQFLIKSKIFLWRVHRSRGFYPGAELSAQVSCSPKQTHPLIKTCKNTEKGSFPLKIGVSQTETGRLRGFEPSCAANISSARFTPEVTSEFGKQTTVNHSELWFTCQHAVQHKLTTSHLIMLLCSSRFTNQPFKEDTDKDLSYRHQQTPSEGRTITTTDRCCNMSHAFSDNGEFYISYSLKIKSKGDDDVMFAGDKQNTEAEASLQHHASFIMLCYLQLLWFGLLHYYFNWLFNPN